MQQDNRRSLWDLTRAAGADAERFIANTTLHLPLASLAKNASETGIAAELRDQSVLVSSHEQMTAALALLALDGVARRIVLCPPDLQPEHLSYVLHDGGSGRHRLRSRSGKYCFTSRYPLPHLPDGRACPSTSGQTAPRYRMDSVYLRHDRPPENGGAHAGYLGRTGRAHSRTWRRSDLEHVLRHPALRRPTDLVARLARRWIDRVVEPTRIAGGISCPSGSQSRDAYYRHTVTLAPRADESGGEGNCSEICPHVG